MGEQHRVHVQGFVNNMDEYMRASGDLHKRINYKSYMFLPGIRELYIPALSLSHTKSWYPRFFVSIFQTYSLQRPVPEPSRRPPSVACLASSPASCLGRRRETSPMSWTTALAATGAARRASPTLSRSGLRPRGPRGACWRGCGARVGGTKTLKLFHF